VARAGGGQDGGFNFKRKRAQGCIYGPSMTATTRLAKPPFGHQIAHMDHHCASEK